MLNPCFRPLASTLACTLLLVVTAVFASTADRKPDRETPAWLQPDVLNAALAMQLTAEQRPQFRAVLTETLSELRKKTQKLLRQNNATHLKRKIRTTMRRQLKIMDQQVAKFITPEQQPQYEIYRSRLLEHLQASRLQRRTRATNEHEDGIGTHNPDWH